ncbi:MAG: FAD-binding protein [Dehalococcoidia bacterium]|nr:FAD-binding protein [Dehalococcoidia bacterium]MCB9508171.1 FAD-binding protein [Myxococcales bacterium]
MSAQPIEVDLLVIGSGAGGMAAALRAQSLGANVVVAEASDQYGGSTAISGGVCWVGNNPKIGAAGIEDSDADALRYLEHITRGEVPRGRLEAFVGAAQRMMSWMESNTRVRFDPLVKYTDYYPEAPGGRTGGRSMESRPFDGAALGDELRHLRRPHPQSQILGKFGITAAQAHTMLAGNFRTTLLMGWLFFLYILRGFKRRRFGRDTHLVCGNALAGRLRASLLDRSIPLWRNARATELIIEEGVVVGAVLERDGAPVTVRAKRGVVLAAGGFSRNAEMRQEHQRHPIETRWHAGNPHDLGDGIRLGVDAGAQLAWMREAWWTPVTLVPKSDLAWVLVVEKSLPHGIFVNQNGERFCNEAAPYIDVVIDIYADQAKTGASVPCFLVFDATFRKRFPVGPIAPGYAMPDSAVPRRYREGFLERADTVEGLAEKLGVDPGALRATVERFNGMARAGRDDDFGRGASASDRYYGDARSTPNPCLGALETAPFYAIRVYPGDLGTKGGLVTDDAARVLDAEGSAIPGLFATGNTMASVMGPTYPGAGGTISPALTFGFVAAESAMASAG